VVHGNLQVNFSCINAEQEILIENFIFQRIFTNFLFCIFILYAFWGCLGKKFHKKVESCHKNSSLFISYAQNMSNSSSGRFKFVTISK
jgi:hypothetical protein